MLNIHN